MSIVSVPVMNDSIFEGTEEFNLRLNVPSTFGRAITAGGRDSAVGVITDSTSKCTYRVYILKSYEQLHMYVINTQRWM